MQKLSTQINEGGCKDGNQCAKYLSQIRKYPNQIFGWSQKWQLLFYLDLYFEVCLHFEMLTGEEQHRKRD